MKEKEWIVPPGLRREVKRFENLCSTLQEKAIMICGPSGVGKTFFLEVYKTIFGKEGINNIHRINCAAFSPNLLLSELFGHKKGAFTGATRDRKGHIEKANDGILILEEIGELPPEGQAQLLTFIEDGIFYPVGSETPEEAKVQIVATTNKEKEHFREDFWYRFFPFFVAPLYERRQDILWYCAYLFPEILKYLRPWELLTLLSYDWPGNVRELDRVCQMIRWYREEEKGEENLEMRGYLNNFRGSTQKYTDLYGWAAWDLHASLKDFGLDVDFLEETLKGSGLGLTIWNEIPSFPEGHITERTDDKMETQYSIIEKAILAGDPFDKLWAGFEYFCSLFGRFADEPFDILSGIAKGKTPNFPILDRFDDSLKKTMLQLKAREFAISRVAGEGKAKLENNLDDLLSHMTKEELERRHNDVLMKRAKGNKSQAARLKGVNRSRFRRSWDKLNKRSL